MRHRAATPNRRDRSRLAVAKPEDTYEGPCSTSVGDRKRQHLVRNRGPRVREAVER